MGTVIPLPWLKSFDDISVPWGSNSGSWESVNPSFSVPPTRQSVSSHGFPPGRHKVHLPGIVLVCAVIPPSSLRVCHFTFKKFSLDNNLYSHILCNTYRMLQLYLYSLFFKSHSTSSSALCSCSPLRLGYPFLPYFPDEILFILKNQLKCYHLSVFWPVSPLSLPFSTALFIPSSMFPESHPFLVVFQTSSSWCYLRLCPGGRACTMFIICVPWALHSICPQQVLSKCWLGWMQWGCALAANKTA